MSDGSGRLVALEGIDGCGKSTQARMLVEALGQRGVDAVCFREPGDTEPGRELRRIFVEGRDVTPREELELFVADRRIDVRDNILPALAAGRVVIMDRYYLSSVVYQGALGVDPEEILQLHATFAPPPDLTLLLDITPEVARARIRAQRGTTNTFEGAEYLGRVRALYLGYAAADANIVRIDASREPAAIHADLIAEVVARVEAPSGASNS